MLNPPCASSPVRQISTTLWVVQPPRCRLQQPVSGRLTRSRPADGRRIAPPTSGRVQRPLLEGKCPLGQLADVPCSSLPEGQYAAPSWYEHHLGEPGSVPDP